MFRLNTWNATIVREWIEQGCPRVIDQIHIVLNSAGFGQILPQIFNLENVLSLNMQFDNIKSIPVSLSKMTTLKELNLNYNKISFDTFFSFLGFTKIVEPFTGMVNLKRLYLTDNNISRLPESIGDLQSLTSLDLTGNLIKSIPECILKLTNLQILNLSYNKIKNIPEGISRLRNLVILGLRDNNIQVIPQAFFELTYLDNLDIAHNKIREIPELIYRLVNLRVLYVTDNLLTTLPYGIYHLRRLEAVYHDGNPYGFVPQDVIRTIENTHNINTTYRDSQSVHKNSVQQSLKKSLQNIVAEVHNRDENVIPEILADKLLTHECKDNILIFCSDTSVHSILALSFEDVLRAVSNRIRINTNSDQIKTILNTEMMDSKSVCFTGRISRLVNSLSGFDDLVCINISQNEQIGSVIANIRSKLEQTGQYTYQQHFSQSKIALEELGYDSHTIDDWIKYI